MTFDQPVGGAGTHLAFAYLNGVGDGVITVIGYIASAVFLALAMRKLPLGTAYAMWTGFGIMGTTILGVLLFKETMSLAQAGCVLMIAGGIIGLKLLA